jgi:crotonobetainyl-CoA:carnitine CoA-transferase CaiB-like acyl-CoA transferase
MNNPVFCSLNRNKRSIVLDTRKPEAQAVLDLIDGADVVVNNFRAGVMERMGFGYEDLSAQPAHHLRLRHRVWPVRPLRAQGRAGRAGPGDVGRHASALRRRDADVDLSDRASPTIPPACTWCRAILLALLQRGRPAGASASSVSLYDSMLAMQTQEAAMRHDARARGQLGAMPLSGVFDHADGAVVLVGAFKANPLRTSAPRSASTICRRSALPPLPCQVDNKAELQAMFRERFASGSTEHWLARLEEQDLLCAPVLDLPQALGHGQTAVNGIGDRRRGARRVDAAPRIAADAWARAPSPFAMRRPISAPTAPRSCARPATRRRGSTR